MQHGIELLIEFSVALNAAADYCLHAAELFTPAAAAATAKTAAAAAAFQMSQRWKKGPPEA